MKMRVSRNINVFFAIAIYSMLMGCGNKSRCLIVNEVFDKYDVDWRADGKQYDHEKHIVSFEYDSIGRVRSTKTDYILLNDATNDSLPDEREHYLYSYKDNLIEQHNMYGNQVVDTTLYFLNAGKKIKSFFENRNKPPLDYNYFYDKGNKLESIRVKEFEWAGPRDKQLKWTDIYHYYYDTGDKNPIRISDSVVREDWVTREFLNHPLKISVTNYLIEYETGNNFPAFNDNIYKMVFLNEFPGFPDNQYFDKSSFPQYILNTPDKLVKSIIIERTDRTNDIFTFSYKIDQFGNITGVEKTSVTDNKKVADYRLTYTCNSQ